MADYKPETEKGECIFCKIASGELRPMGEGMIYEDEDYMAWLSPFPNTEGFSIIAPKRHYSSDVLAMPEKDLNSLIAAAKKVSNMLIDYFEDVGRVGLIMEGTGIDHAHIKLFPMHGTGNFKKGEWKQFHSQVNTYFDKYKGYISSNDGPKADFEKLKVLAEKIRKTN